MNVHQQEIQIKTDGQGLYEISDKVRAVFYDTEIELGICNVFIKHTSASLVIQENADPSARYDLERWLQRLVPEEDPHFTHVFEGADDMPAHIKSALTATTLSIPVSNRSLVLGTWQGIYVWEHRDAPHARKVFISVLGV